MPDPIVTLSTPPAPMRELQRAVIMKAYLDEQTEQRKLLKHFVEHHMLEGVDYGTLPGTDRRALFKPGGEKLTDLYLCTACFTIVDKIQDWERSFFYYQFKVEIRTRESGIVIAEGFGACNSKESKYRWRTAKRTCPSCGREEAFHRSKKPGEGYYCWAKVGGCGATFPDGAPEIVHQPLGRVENDDPFTLDNTILKMAKKRAHVDGAIALARCSDIFTQDVVDDDEVDDRAPAPSRGVPSHEALRTDPEVKALFDQLGATEAKRHVTIEKYGTKDKLIAALQHLVEERATNGKAK